MIRRPPRSTLDRSSAASDVYKRQVHVSPEQAIKIHFDVKSIKSIAMHWGTFQLADDGMYEPKTLLDSLTDEMGIENFIALKNGESIKIR